MGAVSDRPGLPRGVAALLVLGVVTAATVPAVALGLRPDRERSLQTIGARGRLDYGRDALGALRPLEASFVNEVLGSTASGSLLSITGEGTPARTRLIHVVPEGHVYPCAGAQQTEDPMSPPCIAEFHGDNGDATATGVTGDDVRVLIYMHGGTSHGAATDAPRNRLVDLGEPPSPADHAIITGLRKWQDYFNRRYQFYGRRLHLFLYFNGKTLQPGRIKADAYTNFQQVHPFAVIGNDNWPWYGDSFRRYFGGVPVFEEGRHADNFAEVPGTRWTARPSMAREADLFAGFVCHRMVGRPVALDQLHRGQARKLGLVYGGDDPARSKLATMIRQRVEACGGVFAATASFPGDCFAQDTQKPVAGDAAQQMSDFQRQGITTILWPGCINDGYGIAATGLSYTPEWLLLGDGSNDSYDGVATSRSGQAFDRHAIMLTPEPLESLPLYGWCRQAFAQVDAIRTPVEMETLCLFYVKLRLLATGVQAAGPDLTPQSMARGLERLVIPRHPTVPWCDFTKDDGSCVTDLLPEIWDARQNRTAGGTSDPLTSGCWMVLDGGRRRLANEWPATNVDAGLESAGPCNEFNLNAATR
jgi:hypothetical protein